MRNEDNLIVDTTKRIAESLGKEAFEHARNLYLDLVSLTTEAESGSSIYKEKALTDAAVSILYTYTIMNLIGSSSEELQIHLDAMSEALNNVYDKSAEEKVQDDIKSREIEQQMADMLQMAKTLDEACKVITKTADEVAEKGGLQNQLNVVVDSDEVEAPDDKPEPILLEDSFSFNDEAVKADGGDDFE